MAAGLLVLGLILFIGLVVVHEFGHFIMARRGGVDVEEFGIGFPPSLWKKRVKSPKGDFDFTINALPLGGFVRLKGENDADMREGSFGAARLKTKMSIMAAGVVMNLLTAFVLLTALAAIGMPKLIDNQFTVASDTKVTQQQVLVGYIEPNSPADKAGLETQDHLLSIEPATETKQTGIVLKNATDLPGITSDLSGQSALITFERNGEMHQKVVQLRDKAEVNASKNTDNPKGYLGIVPTEYVVRRSTWSSPIVAAGFIKQVTELTFKGLGNAIAGIFQGNGAKASEQVGGPVAIFVILKDGSLLGYQFTLMIIAIISLTLAIMNVLPIPALDGGRLFVTLLFRILKKPLTKQKEDLIHGTGFVALMLLFVLITAVDIKRFF